MSKKSKIIGIIAMVVAVAVLTGIGSFFILRGPKQAVEGGNVLDVEWYDINGKEFTISTVDEFYDFANLSVHYDFKGQTVKLGADIVVNEGNAEDWADAAPERKWTPIDGFAGTFDGQGHTISGLYAKGSSTAIAMFSNTKGSCKIQNFSLKNSYFEGRGFGGVASIASNGGGKFSKIYSDALVTLKGKYSGYAGGIASTVILTASFNECWYDGVIKTEGRDNGGIVDSAKTGVTTISHCLFSGKIESTWSTTGSRTGGIVGSVMTEGTGLNLDDSLATGTVNAEHASLVGSILGNSAAGTVLKSANTYGSVATYKSTFGNGGANGTINSSPLEMPGENLAGVKAYQWTNLDFDKYWAVVEEGTPILKCFAETVPSLEGVEKAYDASWYSETASEGVITTVEQLYGFYVLSGNTNFKGKTIKLGADIVFNTGKASDWGTKAPANVWYQVTGFAGTFDGQGHTISGLYMATDGRYVGFFKTTTQDSNVKNFSIKNCLLVNNCEGTTTAATTGSVAGAAHGKFENIYSDAIVNATGAHIGGMFGQVYQKTTISNCWFDGKVTNVNGRYTGGVVGTVTASTVTIEHCLNTGTVDVNNPTGYCNSGGIIGATLNSAGIALEIKDCLNVGQIITKQGGVGSIIGHVVSGVVTINDCYALKGSNTKDNKGVGHVQGGLKGGVVTMSEEMLTGFKAYEWTTLDYSKYWAVVSNGTPMLQTWAKTVPSVAGRQKAFDISWYDSTKDEYVIKTAKQLYGFYIMSGTTNYKDQTVKLGANITVNSGNAADWKTSAPANVWFPIESFAGTFDGQGHTISGLYINTGVRYCGFFSQTTKDAVVKNFKLTNSIVIADGADPKTLMSTGSIAGAAHGRFEGIYTNALLYTTGAGNGGMFGQVYLPTVISNCQFDGRFENIGRYSGGIVGAMTGQTLRIEHCLNSGYVKITQPLKEYCNSGGIIGANYHTSESLEIIDCLNTGIVDANQGGVGSVLGHCVKGVVTIENTYAASESNTRDGKAVGNVQDKVIGEATQLPASMMTGINGYRTTYLDFAKYWNAIANTTPQLKKFSSGGLSTAGVSKLYDTSWYNANKSEFVLTTVEQFYGFAQLTKSNDFAGKTIKLGANLTLNTGDAGTWLTTPPTNGWLPTGKFAGTFDGQGYTISGLYVAPTPNAGIFGQTTKDTVVKHVRIENSLIQGGTNAGSVAGSGAGTFYAIYSDAIVKSAENQIGGILGYASADTTIELVQFNGHAVTEKNQVGGLIGTAQNAYVTVKNCDISGVVETTTASGHMNCGMVVGRMCGTGGVTIEKSFLSGYMKVAQTTRNFANAYVGKMDGKDVWIDINNSVRVAGHIEDVHANLTQGHSTANTASIWAQGSASAKTLTEEQLVGEKAWFNTELDFYMNTTDMSEGKAWLAIEDKMPLLRIFAENQTVVDLSQFVQADTSWLNDTAGSKNDPYIIANADDLAGLAELAGKGNTFEGKFIELAKDINYNAGAPATEAEWATYEAKNIWKPIAKFAGHFDGKGHKITGLYTEAGDGAALFTETTESAVVENLLIKDSYFKGASYVASISGKGGGTFRGIYSSAIMRATGNYIAGIIGRVTEPTTVEQTQFDGFAHTDTNMIGGIAGVVYNTTMWVKDCHISGTVSTFATGHMNTGLVVGRVHHATDGKAYVYIYKSLINGYIESRQTTRNYANVYIGKMEGAQAWIDVQYSNIVTTGHMHSTCVNLTQGLNAGSIWVKDNTSKTFTDAQLTGTNAVLNTRGLSYCANADDTTGTWVATKDGAPKLRIFAVKEEIADVSALEFESHGWYTSGEHAGTKEDPYVIDTMGELIGFQRLVFSGEKTFEGEYVSLGADLVFNTGDAKTWGTTAPSRAWQQISNPLNQFKGTFDGKGHSVSGLYLKNTGSNVGFFGYTAANSTVKNLKILNSYFEGKQNIGGVTGSGGGTYKAVYSDAIVLSKGGTLSGGIIGNANANATLDNVQFAGTVKAPQQTGGIIGGVGASKTVTIKNSLMSGTVSSTRTDNGFGNVAGLIGIVMAGTTSAKTTVTAENCLISGDITISSNTTGGYGEHFGQIQANSIYNAKCVWAKKGCPKEGYGGSMSGSWGTNSNNGRASVEQLTGLNAATNTTLYFYSSATDTTEGKAFVAIEGGMPQLKVFADPSKILTIE